MTVGGQRSGNRIGALSWFLLAVAAAASAMEIPLEKNGGVFEVPVRINGVITLNFIIDSGAATVQIPADVASTLLRTGTISKDDFLPGAEYELADGTSVTSPRFVLRHLELAGYRVDNVEASVGAAQGSLLLGQTLLERFPQWSLDNRRHVLVLGEADAGDAAQPPPAAPDADVQRPAVEQEAERAGAAASERQPAAWQADWGNGIRATVQRTACLVKEYKGQGYRYLLTVDIPVGRLRATEDAWAVSGERAMTVQGCWFPREDGLVHAKMQRKKDRKTWEQDLNLADGSWTTIEGPQPDVPNQAAAERFLYYAAETAPTGASIPPEAPLCYRFQGASLEMQMEKLKRKYGDALYGVRIVAEHDSRTLSAERKGPQQETISYRYFEDPNQCMEYQKAHIQSDVNER